MVGGTLVRVASAIHKVAKYYRRPKQSSNKIRILKTKFGFGKETNLTSPVYTKSTRRWIILLFMQPIAQRSKVMLAMGITAWSSVT